VITEADLPGLQASLAWAAFAVSTMLGALMHRTHFCTMGAIADIVNIGDWTRMRMWVAAIGVAILATQGLALADLFDPSKTFYAAPTFSWLSDLVGGALFGFGMVLASGCGARSLIRLGTGNLKSLIVLVVMGLAAYMTLRGLTAVVRVGLLDAVRLQLPHGQDLVSLLASDDAGLRKTVRLLAGLIFGGGAIAWALTGSDFRRPKPVLGAVSVGLAVALVWYLSGHLGYLPEHPKTLEEAFVATNSGRPESLSFVGPVAYTLELLMFWSDASRSVTIGIASALGLAVGAFVHALATRTFRWEGFAGVEDTANHLVGATLMGIGGVTALGCTIGQGISGVSTLSVGSALALAAIMLGAIGALRYQSWRIDRLG
jgi:uncharacterized protein